MELSDEAADLADLMSQISEEAFCAGWMSGLEHSLWEIIHSDRRSYGQTVLTEQQVSRLRSLSERCGGWIRYDFEKGEVFVPRDVWIATVST